MTTLRHVLGYSIGLLCSVYVAYSVMKRVQALVSGKKKQCTKLPTPAQKGKKSESGPSSPGGTAKTSTGTGKATAEKDEQKLDSVDSKNEGRETKEDTVPGGEEKTGGGEKTTGAAAGGGGGRGGGIGTSIGARNSPATASTTSVSSNSSTLTNCSTNKVPAVSKPAQRGISKIPASPKKKVKEGSGSTSADKSRVRQDSENKSKTKPKLSSSFSRKSSKDSQKTEQKGKTPKDRTESSSAATSSSSQNDSGFVTQSLFAVESQPISSKSGQGRHHGESTSSGHDPRHNVATMHEPSTTLVSGQYQRQELTVVGHGAQSHQGYAQGHMPHPRTQLAQPLHGILKESSSTGSAQHPKTMNYYQGPHGQLFFPAEGRSTENVYERYYRPPSRSSSARGSSDHMYHPGFNSLPRSRSITPTPDGIYSYASLPRRSNCTTPTQNVMFNGSNNNVGQSWSSLVRKAESDSGFAVPGPERGYNNPMYGYAGGVQQGNPTKTGQAPSAYSTACNINHQPPRPGSVPPHCGSGNSGSQEMLYGGVPRPGSVPPQYYSDTETSGGYYRGARAGSVPLGYESEGSGYGTVGPSSRSYESDSGYGTAVRPSNLRTLHPEDEQYRAAPGKRPVPRRHTVGAPHKRDPETERKRAAFMQLLAQRYPQYADKIQGTGSSTSSSPTPMGQPTEKPARSRDTQRRRTALVTYDPNQAAQTLEYDDLGTMSDLELPSFQRGGVTRTSLPIVRSASTSLERPLGLVFLVYKDQTKKSLLPNEITSLDTVRALFVRAFPDLTLEMLESPRKKVYILDPATSIYFQLEDLGEIKDRSVLKIHETDSVDPQKVRERQEVRGRTVQMPAARSHPRQNYAEVPFSPSEVFTKSQSLPPQASQAYPEMMQDQRNQWEIERRSRSRTPEPSERPRSLSAGATSRQRYSHSPDRLPTPERGSLNPIPENRQMAAGYRDQNYYESIPPGGYRGQYPGGIYDVPAPYPGYPPSSPVPAQPTYVARSTRAPPLAHPQRAVAPVPDMRNNRHSLAFAPMSMAQGGPPPDGGFQRPQNYRVNPPERDGTDLGHTHSLHPPDDSTRWSRNRIEKMEQQLASLTQWVHYQKSDGPRRDGGAPPPRSLGSTTSDSSDTFPASSASKHNGENAVLSTTTSSTKPVVVSSQGLSDVPDGSSSHLSSHHQSQTSSGLSSRESTPLSGQAELQVRVGQLRSDLHILRRQQQLNMEAMKDEFMAAFCKIKEVLSTLPEAENQVNFHKRNKATTSKNSYIGNKQEVDLELADLEASVEELRNDVISRQCRVNVADVEGMALMLSRITKSLADLKTRFPEIHSEMKAVMDMEMRQVVAEEKFLKEEPNEIEASLKRCKKMTGTLYTLKRLASVQDHRPPQIPSIETFSEIPVNDQKKTLLESIRALVPDHDLRMQQMQAAESSRERKKKINTHQEALKFGKSLEMASRNLRPPSTSEDKTVDTGQAEKQEVRATLQQQPVTSPPSSPPYKPAVPAKPVKPVLSSPVTSSASQTAVSPTSTGAFPSSSASGTNVASVKPSFSAALTTSKSSDKPTATVSALTASVSDSVTTTAARSTETTSPVVKHVSFPGVDTPKPFSSQVQAGNGPVTHTMKVGVEMPKKTDNDVPTYQVCGPVSSWPIYKTNNNNNNIVPLSPNLAEKLANAQFDSSKSTPVDPVVDTKSGYDKGKASNKPSSLSTVCTSSDSSSASGGDKSSQAQADPAKGGSDLASQKQAARSAFFSSLSSPPTSPNLESSNRNSAILDPGPIVSPTGVVGKVTPGPTINLMLSGTASPMSPTNPGTFTIAAPQEIKPSSSAQVSNRPPSPVSPAPQGILRRRTSDSTQRQLDSEVAAINQIDVGSNKPKKVPPPPPPRKGSRPTSANLSPVNGESHSSSTQPQEVPRFVGGYLGQHRLSGGPLSSTPISAPHQKQMSRFEQDIVSGLYANMNRPDLQNQKTSSQQLMNNSLSQAPDKQEYSNQASRDDIPPPPSVTLALDRQERGSSSESTSSSSGTSMGSQQSVVSVVRSSSVSVKPSGKSKPEPPRRQSSLLSKITGGNKEGKGKLNNGKAKLNGVDL